MDFQILYEIQNTHADWLNAVIHAMTTIMGGYGQIWLVVAIALLIPKKTRWCGLAILISYALVFVVGQFGLKDLIARARPCQLDQTVTMLVKCPSSYSCPSTHTAWAFAAATSIFCYFKKPGIVVLIIAALIGFSRMYLFVHFPTDVLLGAVMGALLAWLTSAVVKKCTHRQPALTQQTTQSNNQAAITGEKAKENDTKSA